jgi:lysophospholipase L1-like esterase
LTAVLAAVTALFLGAGFLLAVTGRVGEPIGLPEAKARPEPRRDGVYRVVALGDSITRGVGDRRGGYVERAADALRRRGRQVVVTNLAASGDETGDLLRLLADSAEARAALAAADLVVVSIGGNDFSHALRGGRAERSERAGSPDDDVEIEAALVKARANLREILQRLRALAPAAAIRALGLYNPFEIAVEGRAAARAQLLAWNNVIEEATHPLEDALAVPLADLFERRPDRLAGDRFHPGGDGHALIAERLLTTLPEPGAATGISGRADPSPPTAPAPGLGNR